MGANWCANELSRNRLATQQKANKLGLSYGMTKPHYQEDTLKLIVSESTNVSEVLRKLGLRVAGGNHKMVKDYIKKYNLDTSHFDNGYSYRVSRLESYRDVGKIPITDILVENSNYSRGALKKRLVNDGLLRYICRKCGNDGVWLDEPITLQLEHKNGVYNDNRLDNLEFLCPNCHTQTATYAGKNIKTPKTIRKPKIKLDRVKTKGLGKESERKKMLTNERLMNNGLTNNQLEFMKSRQLIERPAYDVLTNDIETLGYSGTGRKYGVSDNAIRKWKKFHEKYNCLVV